MITLIREVVKIIRQSRGSQNIFGYRSTVANQLYLLYCFSGHIYFCNKIHKQVKYLWCFVIACQLTFASTIALDYLWYLSIDDVMMLFNVINAIGAIQMTTMGIPSIVYLFGDRIEKMIKHVDDILAQEINSGGFKQHKIMADSKQRFASFLAPYSVCSVVYFSVCVLDLVLFFEEYKATNYLYYPYPPPMVQTYGSDFRLIFVMQFLTSLMFMFMIFESFSVFSLVLYWNVICCNELIDISTYLFSRSRGLNNYESMDDGYRVLARWDTVFECTLEHSIKKFQKTTQ